MHAPVGKPLLQGGGKPGAKGQHVNEEGSEAIKESPIAQGKAGWAGWFWEKMEALCWRRLEWLPFSLTEGLFFFSVSFILVVYSLAVA